LALRASKRPISLAHVSMATGSDIGSGRLLEASRGGSGSSRLGGGAGHVTRSEVAQAVRDRSSNAAVRLVLHIFADRLCDNAHARSDACLGFAETDLGAQAVSVRFHPALKFVAQFDLQRVCLGGFQAPPVCLPPQDDERGYE